MLVTKNLAPGESVYGEKRISVENSGAPNADGTPNVTKTEYRVWNPFRSKLAAGVLGGLDEIFIKPGAKVLYLGAASGTSVSHVADIVGPTAQPDQARIVGLNAHLFLKVGGGIVVSIKANCIDSTAAPEAVFAREVVKLREERIKPLEQLTLGKLAPLIFNLLFLTICRTLRERPLHCCRPLRSLNIIDTIPRRFPVLFHIN